MSRFGEPDLADLLPAYYCMAQARQQNCPSIWKGICTQLCVMFIAIGLCGSGYYYYQFVYIPSHEEGGFTVKQDLKIRPSTEEREIKHHQYHHYEEHKPTKTTTSQHLCADCIKEIDYFKKDITEIHDWRSSINTLITKMQREQDHNINIAIKEALAEFEADVIGLMDYAASYAGGTIVQLSKDTRPHPTHRPLSLFKIVSLDVFSSPEEIIRPCVLPGSCFAFRGQRGAVLIKLGTPIIVGGITLSHGSRMLLGQDGMSSAPKNFEVHGFTSDDDYEGTFLGKFTYEWMGTQHQTFGIDSNLSKNQSFELVELKVLSNYGKEEFTCVYRFRVHRRDEETASDKSSQTLSNGPTTRTRKKCC